MANQNDTLHLVLKREWYEMIESGFKKEEYRATSAYWYSRLLDVSPQTILDFGGSLPSISQLQSYGNLLGEAFSKGYSKVKFLLGYSNEHTMTYELLSIRVGIGNPDWGAPKDKFVFILKLGKRIS